MSLASIFKAVASIPKKIPKIHRGSDLAKRPTLPSPGGFSSAAPGAGRIPQAAATGTRGKGLREAAGSALADATKDLGKSELPPLDQNTVIGKPEGKPIEDTRLPTAPIPIDESQQPNVSPIPLNNSIPSTEQDGITKVLPTVMPNGAMQSTDGASQLPQAGSNPFSGAGGFAATPTLQRENAIAPTETTNKLGATPSSFQTASAVASGLKNQLQSAPTAVSPAANPTFQPSTASGGHNQFSGASNFASAPSAPTFTMSGGRNQVSNAQASTPIPVDDGQKPALNQIPLNTAPTNDRVAPNVRPYPIRTNSLDYAQQELADYSKQDYYPKVPLWKEALYLGFQGLAQFGKNPSAPTTLGTAIKGQQIAAASARLENLQKNTDLQTKRDISTSRMEDIDKDNTTAAGRLRIAEINSFVTRNPDFNAANPTPAQVRALQSVNLTPEDIGDVQNRKPLTRTVGNNLVQYDYDKGVWSQTGVTKGNMRSLTFQLDDGTTETYQVTEEVAARMLNNREVANIAYKGKVLKDNTDLINDTNKYNNDGQTKVDNQYVADVNKYNTQAMELLKSKGLNNIKVESAKREAQANLDKIATLNQELLGLQGRMATGANGEAFLYINSEQGNREYLAVKSKIEKEQDEYSKNLRAVATQAEVGTLDDFNTLTPPVKGQWTNISPQLNPGQTQKKGGKYFGQRATIEQLRPYWPKSQDEDTKTYDERITNIFTANGGELIK